MTATAGMSARNYRARRWLTSWRETREWPDTTKASTEGEIPRQWPTINISCAGWEHWRAAGVPGFLLMLGALEDSWGCLTDHGPCAAGACAIARVPGGGEGDPWLVDCF